MITVSDYGDSLLYAPISRPAPLVDKSLSYSPPTCHAPPVCLAGTLFDLAGCSILAGFSILDRRPEPRPALIRVTQKGPFLRDISDLKPVLSLSKGPFFDPQAGPANAPTTD